MPRRALSLSSGFRTLLGIHALSTVVSAANALLFSRFLGPEDYAVFAICGTFVTVIRIVGRWGISGYLTNALPEAHDRHYNEAGTYLLVLLLAATPLFVASAAVVSWLGRLPQGRPYLLSCSVIPILAIPAVVLSVRLEREFRWRTAGVVDVACQLGGMAVALGLFVAGAGLWAPVSGLLARISFHSLTLSRIAPGLRLSLAFPDTTTVRAIFQFGFKQSSVVGLFQLRQLLFITLITRFAGDQVAGHYALATRLYDMVNPTRAIVTRLVPPSLAEDAHRRGFRTFAATAFARLEALASGVMVVAVAPLVLWLLPRLLGDRWNDIGLFFLPVAAAMLLNSPFHPLWNICLAKRRFAAASGLVAGLIAMESLASWQLFARLGAGAASWIPFVALVPFIFLQRHCARQGISPWPRIPVVLAAGVAALACLGIRHLTTMSGAGA